MRIRSQQSRGQAHQPEVCVGGGVGVEEHPLLLGAELPVNWPF